MEALSVYFHAHLSSTDFFSWDSSSVTEGWCKETWGPGTLDLGLRVHEGEIPDPRSMRSVEIDTLNLTVIPNIKVKTLNIPFRSSSILTYSIYDQHEEANANELHIEQLFRSESDIC